MTPFEAVALIFNSSQTLAKTCRIVPPRHRLLNLHHQHSQYIVESEESSNMADQRQYHPFLRTWIGKRYYQGSSTSLRYSQKNATVIE